MTPIVDTAVGLIAALLGHAGVFAQGIPLAPPLHTRLIALVVIEIFLITTAVLLYVRWIQLTREPLDEWWESRKRRVGLSPRTRALMEESERERLAQDGRGGAPQEPPPE